MLCTHDLRLHKDPEMTESNLRWLAFGWRNVSVVDFFSISLICVTFSGYLYEEKHSPQSSWMRPLLKLAEMLLSRCQMEEDELSLDSLLQDSMTGLLCREHFPLTTLCSTVFYTVWRQQNDGLLVFLQSAESSDLLILLCHLVVHTWSTNEVSVSLFSTSTLCFFCLFLGVGGGSEWAAGKKNKQKNWTGQQSLAALKQIDRQSFTLMLVPVGSFTPDLRVFVQGEETTQRKSTWERGENMQCPHRKGHSGESNLCHYNWQVVTTEAPCFQSVIFSNEKR